MESPTQAANLEINDEQIRTRSRRRIDRNGVVLYFGPSQIDGSGPIVAIATGLRRPSCNSKTLGMIQTWILRADMPPTDARRTGADHSICGDCALRNGACYVTLHQAPRSVFAAYLAGKYRTVEEVGFQWAARKAIRLGSYGDPAAVPSHIWLELAARARIHTGYTHSWREHRMQPLRRILMASVDTAAEAWEAWKLGWRSYRVRLASDALLPHEAICPASHEGGQRTTCDDCGQCNGAAPYDLRSSYATIAHGSGRATYRSLRVLQ